jgi:hypothetical protein
MPKRESEKGRGERGVQAVVLQTYVAVAAAQRPQQRSGGAALASQLSLNVLHDRTGWVKLPMRATATE